MTTICLIRHGETDWNYEGRLQGRENIELNENGRFQANCCANYLTLYSWDVIVTSPLKRARETAQIISEKTGIKAIVEIEELVERDYGKASGLTVQERKEMFPDGNVEGQEDWNHLKDRAMNAITHLVGRYTGKRMIVVSHGGVINAILSAITNGEIGTGKTVLKNACVNILHFDGEKWKIELCNHTVFETV